MCGTSSFHVCKLKKTRGRKFGSVSPLNEQPCRKRWRGGEEALQKVKQKDMKDESLSLTAGLKNSVFEIFKNLILITTLLSRATIKRNSANSGLTAPCFYDS